MLWLAYQLRPRLPRRKLSAHFLNLCCLLFQLRSENAHAFLECHNRGVLLCRIGRQVPDRHLLLLDFLVLR